MTRRSSLNETGIEEFGHEHVRANPGITASEIAKKMRIKPDYVPRRSQRNA